MASDGMRCGRAVVVVLGLLLVQACSDGGGSGVVVVVDPLVTPEVRSSRDGVLQTTLRAARSPVEVAGLKGDRLVYEGTYPGPTLRVKPGDRMLVDLVNDIADAPTNLHFHGYSCPSEPGGHDLGHAQHCR